jgi:hypothetical protein
MPGVHTGAFMKITETQSGLRQCCECKDWKPVARFRTESTRVRYTCLDCHNQRRRARVARRPDLQEQNRQSCATRRVRLHVSGLTYGKVQELKKKFGLTPDEFLSMWAAQGGRCICGESLVPGKGGCAIDHDHGTGKIRGLLCNGCNSAIGWCREDVARLRAIIRYLEQHHENRTD